MPYPKTLLSSYPPKCVDELIEERKPKKIHIYVDLKNAMTSMFVPSIVEEIALNTLNSGKLDSSIFQSVLFYSIWWKKYSQQKNIPCSIFITTDTGRSEYHLQINKYYKHNRAISSFTLTPYDQDFREIKSKNIDLLDNVCKRLPGMYCYKLNCLESDFLPYWLITRKYNDPDIFNVLVSSDHDMHQMITKPNIIQLYRLRGVSKE